LIQALGQDQGLVSACRVVQILRAARVVAECHVGLPSLVVNVEQLEVAFYSMCNASVLDQVGLENTDTASLSFNLPLLLQ
jgi:hypothetical protein